MTPTRSRTASQAPSRVPSPTVSESPALYTLLVLAVFETGTVSLFNSDPGVAADLRCALANSLPLETQGVVVDSFSDLNGGALSSSTSSIIALANAYACSSGRRISAVPQQSSTPRPAYGALISSPQRCLAYLRILSGRQSDIYALSSFVQNNWGGIAAAFASQRGPSFGLSASQILLGSTGVVVYSPPGVGAGGGGAVQPDAVASRYGPLSAAEFIAILVVGPVFCAALFVTAVGLRQRRAELRRRREQAAFERATAGPPAAAEATLDASMLIHIPDLANDPAPLPADTTVAGAPESAPGGGGGDFRCSSPARPRRRRPSGTMYGDFTERGDEPGNADSERQQSRSSAGGASGDFADVAGDVDTFEDGGGDISAYDPGGMGSDTDRDGQAAGDAERRRGSTARPLGLGGPARGGGLSLHQPDLAPPSPPPQPPPPLALQRHLHPDPPPLALQHLQPEGAPQPVVGPPYAVAVDVDYVPPPPSDAAVGPPPPSYLFYPLAVPVPLPPPPLGGPGEAVAALPVLPGSVRWEADGGAQGGSDGRSAAAGGRPERVPRSRWWPF